MKKNTNKISVLSVFGLALAVAGYSQAADKNYSPYVNQSFPQNVYFGDTHLHTSYSADAGMVGNTTTPDQAYRVAKGETITSPTGLLVQLKRPLDFVVISDHAENLGLAPFIARSDESVMESETGKKWHDMVKAGKGYDAFIEWVATTGTGEDPIKSKVMAKTAWADLVEAAERHNQPGVFTAIHGFEWTSMPGGNNLHRNVIFRDGADKVSQIIPLSLYDSEDPEDLWDYLAAYEKNTGGRVFAIPHNGNMSNGTMFAPTTFTGKPLDEAYVRTRAHWEPVYETTQIKGDGETHSFLSPDDAFADFETLDKGNLSGKYAKTDDMLQYEYTRAALRQGLSYESKLGTNPFKFGVIGSTDAHNGIPSSTEENNFGKANIAEPSPERFEHALIKSPTDPALSVMDIDLGASGLAAVWSRENTRESLWDSFHRKEVYATTGSRLRMRFFGGWNFEANDVHRQNFAAIGYEKGVPMGGDLTSAPDGKSPSFMVLALKDPEGANLDRIQVVKGWLDKNGQTHEKIFNVVMSGQREVEADGSVKPVGSTVDVASASFTNTIGAVQLATVWTDPEFDPKQKAFYYARVLEIPVPRWSTHDAAFFDLKIPEGVPESIQDRAYSSAIWYTP
jgi:hypothetical protein